MYTIHLMSNSQITFLRIGAEDTLPEAIAFARNYHGLKRPDVTVTVEIADTARPVVSFSTRRIMGDFQKQMWGGHKGNDAIDCGEERFDATLYILSLPYTDVVKIRDNHESSDEIGRALVSWNGPHEVQLVDSMCDFFGVARLAELTEDHFRYVVGCRKDEIKEGMRVAQIKMQEAPTAQRVPSPAEAARDLIMSLAKLALPGETGPDGKVYAPTEGAAQAQLAALIGQSRAIMAHAEALAYQNAAAHAAGEDDEPTLSPRH